MDEGIQSCSWKPARSILLYIQNMAALLWPCEKKADRGHFEIYSASRFADFSGVHIALLFLDIFGRARAQNMQLSSPKNMSGDTEQQSIRIFSTASSQPNSRTADQILPSWVGWTLNYNVENPIVKYSINQSCLDHFTSSQVEAYPIINLYLDFFLGILIPSSWLSR